MLDETTGVFDAQLGDKSELADLQKGDRVAFKSKVGANTVRAIECNDFTAKDLLFTKNSAVSLVVDGRSNRTIIEQVRLERSGPINGVVPFFAGPGGGPQITAETEGPIIRGCEITSSTDDAIAVFSFFQQPGKLMSGALIEDNFIRDTQGRGINITQSRDGICRNNTIVRGQNPSIQLKSNQNADGTKAAVLGWIIEKNTLTQPWTDATIHLTREQGNTSSGLHDQIIIRDNVILEASRNNAAIQINHAQRVTVSNNRIQSFSGQEDVPDKDVPSPAPLLFVEEALPETVIEGDGNVCEVKTERPAVLVGKGTGKVQVTWTIP
ncbi:MAG: right-handed parallel beta-helix repeat-containing protein [Polyangiaceae bacterium]|nr:right-handed parallel beta-helix repeat-containing protein [Polyangiaceae bacterium]